MMMGTARCCLGFPWAGEAEGEAALEVAVEDDEEQQQDASACPYWVSVSRRSQFRRLHAKDKCGVLPWTVFRAEGFQTVGEANADAWCKICWRKISHDGAEASREASSSGSSSSTEAEAQEEESPAE